MHLCFYHFNFLSKDIFQFLSFFFNFKPRNIIIKLILIFLFSTFVTVYTASCRQRCNDVYNGAGERLKHFSDGPLCKCSLAPISSIKSASACDRHL